VWRRPRVRACAPTNESRVFRIATALEPAAGTSASDHLAAALVPIAVAGAAAWADPRLRPGLRAGVALVFGALTLAAGVIGISERSVSLPAPTPSSETAAHRHDLGAVVADATTTESLSDVRHISRGSGLFNVLFFAVRYAAAEVLGHARQMPPLATLAAEARGTPMFWPPRGKWSATRAAHGELWRVEIGRASCRERV